MEYFDVSQGRLLGNLSDRTNLTSIWDSLPSTDGNG
jgi:hypothetical protein